MTKQDIEERFQKSYCQMKDNIHSAIAEELGIKHLYAQDNMWCSIGDYGNNSITISGSTFEYSINTDGFEKINLNISSSISNAGREHPPLKIKDINNIISSKRGDLESTSAILKAICKSKKYILSQLDLFKKIDYKT